ncbi:molybdopterin converting factor subunit 1 [Aquabacterium sp. A3]|uniref:molybdopterin converting factor subunit 1 n=1 Tax=Aquabacterium sp. A3 TaxID=3132829 RepID=UPI00311953D4
MITVRYFAALREKLGAQDEVSLADWPAPHTVAALRAHLCQRSAGHAAAFDGVRALRAARNQQMCDDDEALTDGDEVAFFPPVTGG